MDKPSKRGRARKGTHGSLSKAGKMRSQNPRSFREEKSKRGIPFYGKKSKTPRVKNRRKYEIATMCPACGCNISVHATSCWRCETRFERRGTRPIKPKQKASLGRRFR